MLYCYKKSNDEHERMSGDWVYYHLGFHGLITTQLFLTVTYMGKEFLKKKIK